MVAVHLSSMINSAENAEHLSVIWKMPLKDAEAAANLLSLQCTKSSLYFTAPAILPLPPYHPVW